MNNHLTKEERDQICYLRTQGLSLSEIGRQLNRNKSTISREIRRNSRHNGQYLSISANDMSEARWKISHKKLRLKTPFIKEIVIDWIMRGWAIGKSQLIQVMQRSYYLYIL